METLLQSFEDLNGALEAEPRWFRLLELLDRNCRLGDGCGREAVKHEDGARPRLQGAGGADPDEREGLLDGVGPSDMSPEELVRLGLVAGAPVADAKVGDQVMTGNLL